MIHKMPGQLPYFRTLVDDMLCSSPDVAKYLGVTHRTLRRWYQDNEAPRTVMLSLFWASRWGVSVFDCESINTERLLRSQLNSSRDECANLIARIARLERLGDFGCANEPEARRFLA